MEGPEIVVFPPDDRLGRAGGRAGDGKRAIETAGTLLKALKRNARGKAIYIEFRNYFDTSPMRAAFEANGFEYKEHLNLLVKLGDEESVLKRMGRDRKRQVRISLETGRR